VSAAEKVGVTVVEALGAKVEAPSVEALSVEALSEAEELEATVEAPLEAEELEATVAEKVAAPSVVT